MENPEVWKVKIMDEKNVVAVKCTAQPCSVEAGGIAGTWDILFEQALVVSLSNKLRFLANFHYTVKLGSTNGDDTSVNSRPAYEMGAETFKNLKNTDDDKFKSNCQKTMVGFIQDSNEK